MLGGDGNVYIGVIVSVGGAYPCFRRCSAHYNIVRCGAHPFAVVCGGNGSASCFVAGSDDGYAPWLAVASRGGEAYLFENPVDVAFCYGFGRVAAAGVARCYDFLRNMSFSFIMLHWVSCRSLLQFHSRCVWARLRTTSSPMNPAKGTAASRGA